MSIDRVFARQIRLDASIGVLPWEREARQMVEVDFDAYVDTVDVLATGDLSKGVDFAQAISLVRELVLREHVDLVETLADRVANTLLSRTPATKVRVEIRKYCSCASMANHVGVCVERSKNELEQASVGPTS